MLGKFRRNAGRTLCASLLAVALAGGPLVTGTPTAAAASGVQDPYGDGLMLPPAGDVSERITALQTPRRSARESSARPLEFRTSQHSPRSLPVGQRPYEQPSVHLSEGIVDTAGVRMVDIAGGVYDHPVAQATYGIEQLDAYRLTGRAEHLRSAKAQAARLLDRRVESRGGWFFPYAFDFALHGDTRDLMRAPWFSAMAQGKALTLFVRLHEVTKEGQYATAADRVFATLLATPDRTLPWVNWVDQGGYLWLELYPRWPAAETSDATLNGHIWVIYGLHDYYAATKDPEALRLWRGGIAMVERYAAQDFREPGWISRYCLLHPVHSARYHEHHVSQFLELHKLTGSPAFAALAQTLRVDYPEPAKAGTVRIAGGRHTVYKFNSKGGVTASRSMRLNASSEAPVDRRQRIAGRSIHLRITKGTWAGYWIGERLPQAWLKGSAVSVGYRLSRTATLRHAGLTGYRFSGQGATLTTKKVTRAAYPSVAVDAWALINGGDYLRVASGPLKGLWVPQQRVALR
jgi:hypothetical protein